MAVISAALWLILSMAIASLSGCARAPHGATYSVSIDASAGPALTSVLRSAGAAVDEAAASLGMAPSIEPSATPHVEARIGATRSIDPSALGEGRIAFRRVYLVPYAAPSTGKADATREACDAGREDLAEFDKVPDDRVALSVDGLAIDAPGYPLAYTVFAEIVGDGTPTKRSSKARAALEGALRKAFAEGAAASYKPPDILWLAAAGDAMLGRGAAERWAREGADSVLGGAASILRDADVAVVNLEGAITARGTRASKAYTFRFPAYAARLLSDAGVDAALVSNNHALDYGLIGLTDTKSALEAAGLGALGAGANIDEAMAPFAIAGARLFGISSYPVERSGWDGAAQAAGPARPGIARAENGGAERLSRGFESESVDAVFVHGGQEWSTKPDDKTLRLFRGLIDSGADAVFGSHPHVSQGWELYKGRVIFWSLGNFLFPGMGGTPGGERGLLAIVGFYGERPLYARAVALSLDGTRVGLAKNGR